MKNETQLRAWVARKMKLDEVPEWLWMYLVAHDYVRDAIEIGERGAAELLHAARKQWDVSRELEAPHARHRPDTVVKAPKRDLGVYARERSQVAAEAVALEVAREPQVQKFRSLYLGGSPCSPAEARQLLTSKAAAILSTRYFQRRGIPYVGHTTTVLDRREQPCERGLRVDVDLRIDWDGGSDLQTIGWEENPRSGAHNPVLSWMDEDERLHEVEVWPGTALDWLRQMSERLAKWYDWETAQAAWFVLTDLPPVRAPLEGQITLRSYPALSGSRVTLSIEPWMPAEIVDQTYRAIQQDLLGKSNRPLSARNLELYRFVIAQERKAARAVDAPRAGPTWAQLMERWNDGHPERPYVQERLFVRDVNRARRTILFPNYRLDLGDEEEGAAS